jgi:hypothetical protein
MHMMFVDESGDKGLPKNENWKNFNGTPIYIRIGAIIHGWRWKSWNDKLNQFKKRRGLTWDSEIKATFVRRGKGDFSGQSSQIRALFMSDLLDLIGGDSNITLLGIIIDKVKIDTTRCDRLRKPEIRSMELLLERYNMFLGQQQDKSGIVILDPTQEHDDDNIRYFQSYLQATSPHLKPLNIVEGTFFAKSHTSNMIQIADLCANVLYRNETKVSGAEAEFNKICPRFWRYKNRVDGCGIKKWP